MLRGRGVGEPRPGRVSTINNPEKVSFFLHLCQIFYK